MSDNNTKDGFLAIILGLPLSVLNTLFASFAMLKVFQWFIFPTGLIPVFGIAPICGVLIIKALLSYKYPAEEELKQNLLRHAISNSIGYFLFNSILLGFAFAISLFV
jgi:glucan phosphoethanolaminetransferase (alkaline phosphatase superfamily)